MDVSTGASTTFKAETESFGDLEPAQIGGLIAATSDVAVVLDRDGRVCDLAVSDPDLPRDAFEGWVGQNFRETVTLESQPKVDRLLASAAGDDVTALTHVNHVRRGGEDLPIRYRAASLSDERVIAMGRDLSPLASAQRRLIAAQRNAEREYQRLRVTEARFRQYFRYTDEAALFLDAEDRVSDANPAAAARWPQYGRLTGRRLLDLLLPADRAAVAAALGEIRGGTNACVVPLRDGPLILAPLRQDRSGVLVRFAAAPAGANAGASALPLARVLEAMPDAFVVTDQSFVIQVANASFLAMTEAVAPEAVIGSPLDRWLGRPGVDLSVIRTALAEVGSLRSFATVVQGDLGQTQDVELSAARVVHADGHLVGLSIRQASLPDTMIPYRSGQQLADLVGRVPIKEIVRETTETIERLCIEAALELSGDNRASAAELLGLSRQSLYVKMRRFGIVDAEGNGTESEAR